MFFIYFFYLVLSIYVYFIDGTSTFEGYVMPNPSLQKDCSVSIWPIAVGMSSCLFPKNISPKMNVITHVEFELAYYNVTTQHISYNAPGTLTIYLSQSVEIYQSIFLSIYPLSILPFFLLSFLPFIPLKQTKASDV